MNPQSSHTDEIGPEVVRRIAGGDVAAYEQMYDATSGLLYSLGVRMLERKEDVEELLVEVFQKIWREANHYDPRRGSPEEWAITMTRQLAIEKIRRINRRLHVKKVERDEATGQRTFKTAEPEKIETGNPLKGLTDEVKEIIDLAYFGGLLQSQIAERLALPLTTVKSRMHRGMLQLRQNLRDSES